MNSRWEQWLIEWLNSRTWKSIDSEPTNPSRFNSESNYSISNVKLTPSNLMHFVLKKINKQFINLFYWRGRREKKEKERQNLMNRSGGEINNLWVPPHKSHLLYSALRVERSGACLLFMSLWQWDISTGALIIKYVQTNKIICYEAY